MATRKKSGSSAPAARGARKGGASTITVDFTDVEAGGGMATPDGVYLATVSSAEKEVSQNGNDMIVVRLKTNIGSTVFHRFVLLPQSLWVLRTALDCMGFETPSDEFSFSLEDMVDQQLGIEITNETYEEKDQPRVTGYLPAAAAEEIIEREGGGGKPAKGKSKDSAKPALTKRAAKQEPEDEEDETEEEEEQPTTRRKAPAKRGAVKVPEPDEGEEEADEDEEEEQPPPRKKRGETAAPKKSGALRPGARVVFSDDEGTAIEGVIESIDGAIATVVDDEEGEWDIPLKELTKS